MPILPRLVFSLFYEVLVCCQLSVSPQNGVRGFEFPNLPHFFQSAKKSVFFDYLAAESYNKKRESILKGTKATGKWMR
jgi:hypothetical protein